jgi:predicted DNA-binding transcriptional regulator AlpA
VSITQNVATILKDHVTLEVEAIDRMYLNVCVPHLQWEQGIVGFFRKHLGQPTASSALMAPRTRDFVAALERFVKAHSIPLVQFRKHQRKDDIMADRLKHFQQPEGIVFLGKAQEKTPVFPTEKRRNPQPPAEPPTGDLVTLKDAAQSLGLAASTLHRWINDGFIAGEQITPGAPWRIRLTDELRARFVEQTPPGYLPMLEATMKLGVSRQAVLHRVKRGELEAVHVRCGRRKGLRIKVVDSHPRLLHE